MAPENLIFSTKHILTPDRPQIFYEGFLRDKNENLHAFSEFNFYPEQANHNTLYINILSTFLAHTRGYVEDILWMKYSSMYGKNPKNIDTIRHCTPKMISEIINFSPEYVDYIVIPCSDKREKELKNHYLEIGEQLQKDNIVQNIGYYQHDSIFYKIAK